MVIGDVIKSLRDELGWSQRKLALKAELGNSTISRIEKGLLHPEPETLEKLARVLPTTYEHLMNVAGYWKADRDGQDLYDTLRSYGLRKDQISAVATILRGFNPNIPLCGAMNVRRPRELVAASV